MSRQRPQAWSRLAKGLRGALPRLQQFLDAVQQPVDDRLDLVEFVFVEDDLLAQLADLASGVDACILFQIFPNTIIGHKIKRVCWILNKNVECTWFCADANYRPTDT